MGANTDIGTLRNMLTGAETQRRAAGFRVGYGFSALQLSSGIEYRHDETEAPDLSLSTRKTWLWRNNFKYQLSDASRLLGKLNHSESVSSLGPVLRRRLHRGRARLRVPAGAQRPA